MKECLDYIKKTGEEIKELNDEIKTRDHENKKLITRIGELEKELAIKNQQLDNLSDLANRWWHEYHNVNKKYDILKSKYDAVSIGLATVAPLFKDEIKEDIDEGEFMSELLSKLDSINSRW